ncbi:ABC transporter ATP-binding protein [Labrys wisconsinensis]|uniref:Multiple sugar transport system ATP-binding protein n=1 Tax=Labrys wisconsinensis TaxID=425677 RepID=A0ABU0JKU1_9HYPH|nr:sn-glycerol-3-phosphate ABC transporter ATP-binding protein UgpC [Labrys wisconsinensis]MDQ0474076.1 multiple sugar transport system ATP-binding protein [Labrys wisconsinensis]
MASLSFDRIGKTYDDGTVAVANVSIDLGDGEFVVLVGPSGCGKSTLLRVAAGLEYPDAGRLLIGELDVTDREPGDRDIAMIFQNYALYPHMTVFENMAFGLQQRRTPKAEIERRVTEAARTLDLARYLHRKPGMLSGGQRQRVAMGRAIVRHPAVFLMDEPLSNLDAKLRVQMRAELKLLNQRLGVTTLYVTHDQVEAMTMGDRVAVLKPVGSTAESNLQQIDTPQALYDRPANLFVAGFIGSPSMNFIRGTLTPGGAAARFAVAATDIAFDLPAAALAERPGLQSRLDREVILGVRPESLLVCAAEDAVFRAEVLVAEALGADSFVFFDLPSPPALAEEPLAAEAGGARVNRIAARIPPNRVPPRGERLALTLDFAKLHWFDPGTGTAV